MAQLIFSFLSLVPINFLSMSFRAPLPLVLACWLSSLGLTSEPLGQGGLEGLAFCSSANPRPPALRVCGLPPEGQKPGYLVPVALLLDLRCWEG